MNKKFHPWLQEDNFENWLEHGVLVDWEVPSNKGAASRIEVLAPRKLIKCYADTEACHADSKFAKEFGCSVENWKEQYILNGKTIFISVIYNYLYQIGNLVVKLSNNFVAHYSIN